MTLCFPLELFVDYSTISSVNDCVSDVHRHLTER